ncbi:pyridine nucleotide-disulphide oxidoreductase [Desulfoluna butyratoxydans]|uniref:Pyridine nucleotide-disulphide oxidoreductase n=1 Tax=Desulfoluna butyratoxydans TaxID=231438 RepID=A0A4U8YHN5_9BACT|nr:pyridine nucleotide-disulphide oxidoreductase [Desulfoluna butyratoxydans]
MIDIQGEAGNFEVTLNERPRYVDESKCIACGLCAEKCPKKVTDPYNANLIKRKAIYVEYDQAVPLKYAIDPDTCLKLTKDRCGNCEKVCPTGAIDYTMTAKETTLNVGSVVLATGFKPFDPSVFDTYQYTKFPNVVTSLEFERILSASGPTQGHLTRRSKDGEEPKKIAWFQCIGSRDINRCDNGHCSSVCCMYAIKEAVMAKEHNGDDLDCAIFFMDMRTPGKDFEEYYEKSKDRGIRFVRSRVHTINPIPETDDLEVRYVTEDGTIKTEVFGMIVLSIGLEAAPETVELAKKLDIELTPSNFAATSAFNPVATSREGIYVCGAFQGPKDIPESIVDASAAAAAAGESIASARNTVTKEAETVPQLDVGGERPKIGVFVCSCGTNIAGTVDVEAVSEYAKSLPYVEFVANNLFSCSQDTQDKIAETIKEKGLNRVVVAACTPKTHEGLFQETLLAAGLNKYLFEMTNIRNQDSWVHKDQPEMATEKAKDLIRMSVAKVALFQPLEEAELQVNQTAMVLGGGLAGITTAQSLSRQGYATHIVEREDKLGGNANRLYRTASGENVAEKLVELIDDVTKDDNITVHLNTTLENVEGFVGNFESTLASNGAETVLKHGVAVMATGAQPYTPTEYSYGSSDRIVTSLEMDEKLKADDPILNTVNSAVFIQCVGSREPERPFCSRVCCTHSIDNALEIKRRNPLANVYILYRDIRTYGEREHLYREAREKGVIFIRYDVDNKPVVAVNGDKVSIKAVDHVLRREVEIEADLLSLATAVVPYRDEKVAQFFKLPMNDNGFFVERHAKLGPSEFATDGVFLCGMAHYPKPIDEAIGQAKAAASRAITLLARETIHTSGQVAHVNPALCSSCGICVSVCPYSAPSFMTEGRDAGKAQINPVLCKGCGLCVGSCRSGAIRHRGFDNDQIMSQIFALNEA